MTKEERKGLRMDLLEAILALTKSSSGRQLQRKSLYAAVARVMERLTMLLRVGDEVMYAGRRYFLVDEGARFVAVDTGKGRASLGQKYADIPFASYEEHVFFTEHAAVIVGMFAEMLRKDIKRMHTIERELLEISERKLNAS
jgi:hypothetical protein